MAHAHNNTQPTAAQPSAHASEEPKPAATESAGCDAGAVLDLLEGSPEGQSLIETLTAKRWRGRHGYPPRVMLRAFWLRYLIAERYAVRFIERLRSSPSLRELCGFGDALPSESTFSRFFGALADQPVQVERLVSGMVNKLKERLPDLGEAVAVDSTDIEGYSNPKREPASDADAAWGHRTAKNGSKDKKTEPFFGYKLHTLSDVIHGAPLAFMLLPANKNDSPQLPKLLKKAQGLYPWFRPAHCAADRGYDSQANHRALIKAGSKPIIHIRKSRAEDKLHDGMYETMGAPVCGRDTPMEYVRTDAATGHHLYRCPPRGCILKARSNGAVRYCDVREHWEDPMNNPRVISVVARASEEWKAMYRLRTVIERGFAVLKRCRLLDQHQYLTMRKVETHAGLSVLTYLATMLARVEAGDADRIRHMRLRLE